MLTEKINYRLRTATQYLFAKNNILAKKDIFSIEYV